MDLGTTRNFEGFRALEKPMKYDLNMIKDLPDFYCRTS